MEKQIRKRLISIYENTFSRQVKKKGFFGAGTADGLFGTKSPQGMGHSAEWLSEYHMNPRLAGVNKISTDNGTADFGIFYKGQDGEDLRVLNHPLEQDIDSHTIPMFFSLWTAYRLMTGTTYIVYDMEKGEPTGLKIYTETHIASSDESTITFNKGGDTVTYPRSQVIKDLDLDLNDPYNKGNGRMTSIAEEIELDSWIVKYLKNVYINSAQPGLFIVPKGESPPTSEDLERVSTALGTHHKGIGNAGRTAVLSFDADIKTVPRNHRDLELLETRKALRDAGIQHIGIPPEIMGIVENSNKATVVAAEHIYAKQVRIPILKHFEDVINSQLLPRYSNSKGLKFRFSNILPDDEEMAIAKAKEGREAASITVNEHRRFLGLPQIEGEVGNKLVITGEGPVDVSTGETEHSNVEYEVYADRQMLDRISKERKDYSEEVVVIMEEEN